MSQNIKKPGWILSSFLVALFWILVPCGSQISFGAENIGPTVVLRLDSISPTDLQARNFRTSNDPFKPQSKSLPSRIGLTELHASGSSQPSTLTFDSLKEVWKGKPLIDVDLRQESHGFLNEAPVSWFAPRDWSNRGKDLAQVDADERARLAGALKAGKLTAFSIQNVQGKEEETPFSLKVKSIATEQEVATHAGLQYFRIPVTDHLKPTDADVDRFLEFVQKLPKDAWLHFHCEAGDGRTTTFMSMYDMLRNAKQVSFEDILKRQWLLGGIDLLNPPPQDSWKYPYAVERTEFLRKFYEFAKGAKPQSGSRWK